MPLATLCKTLEGRQGLILENRALQDSGLKAKLIGGFLPKVNFSIKFLCKGSLCSEHHPFETCDTPDIFKICSFSCCNCDGFLLWS